MIRAVSDFHLSEATANLALPALREVRDHANQAPGYTFWCGDIFDQVASIDSLSMQALSTLLKTWPAQDRLIVLVGNHDMMTRSSLMGWSAMDLIFGSRTGVTLASPATLVTLPELDAIAVPYCEDLDALMGRLRLSDGAEHSKLITHIGVQGAYQNSMRRDTDGIAAPAVLHRFAMVVTGHYHLPHSLGSIHYVGSPYQVDFGEEGQQKSFCTWTIEAWKRNEAPVRVPFQIGHKHYTLHWGAADLYPPGLPQGFRPGFDKLRLIVSMSRQQFEYGKQQLVDVGLASVPMKLVEPTWSGAPTAPTVRGNRTLREVVDEYVLAEAEGQDREAVLRMGEELWR